MLTTPSNPTILIVDDSETDRYTYRRYLEPLDKLGYRILDCESAEQALDLCDRDRPQLILLDYLLHDMDGLEFLRQLANRMETLPPTIMLTGEGSEMVAVKAMKLGVKDYLVKRQVIAQNLVNLVTNILLQQKLEDQFDRRYNALFYAIDQGFCRCQMIFDACGKGVDYRFFEINHLFEQMTGLANAEGKTIKELVPNLDEIWFETYGAVVTTGKSIRLESEVVAMDRWFDINAFPIQLSQGHEFGVLFTDISDRKRQELNTNFLVAIQKDLVVLEDPDRIMDIVGGKIRSFFNFSVLTFSDIDLPNGIARSFYSNRDANTPDTVATHIISDYFSNSHIEKFKSGEIVAIADVTTDPEIEDRRAAYLAYQVRSVVNVPYLIKNELKFLLSGSRCEPSNWRSDEIELMAELTERLYLRISRARAEIALQELADELQGILDIVPMGIAIAEDPKCDVIRVNGFGQTMLSVPSNTNVSATGSEAKAVPFRLLQNGQEIPGEKMPMQIAAAEGRTIRDVEMQMVHIEGYTQDWLVNAIPLFNADGSVRGSVAAIADVTKLKQIDADLRQSEEFKNRMLESSPDCIKLIDADGQILYMNEGGISLLEFDDSSQYLYQKWLDFWEDDYRIKAEEAITKAKAGEVGKFCGYRATAKGKPKWWEVHISPIRDASGEIEQLLVVSRDISDRHLQELNANFLAEIQTDLNHLTDPTEIMNVIGEKIRQFFSINLLFFADIDADADRSTVIYNNREADLLDAVDDYYLPDYLGKCYLDRLKTGNTVAIADTHTDPDIVNSGEAYIPYEVRSQVLVPHLGNGKWKFMLGGSRRNPSNWRTDELELLVELTARLYLCIERARAETLLQQSNQRFEGAMQAINGIVYEWHLGSSYVYRSPGLFRLIGIHATDALPTKEWWMERIHPEDRERLEKIFATLPPDCDRLQHEYRVLHADGRWIDVWDRSILERNSVGEIISMTGSTSDISDRKRAESALKKSEERYRQLVELIPQLVWKATPEGLILDVNQRWLDFTGLTLAQVKSEGWENVIHADDFPTLSKYWELAQQEGKYEAEGRMLKADGQYRWHLHQAIAEKNERGQIIKWFGTATDIDELKQLEQEYNDLLVKVQERNQELDQFTHIVSHDLKAPLRAISNLAQWLEDDIADLIPSENQQQLKLIRSRVLRMEGLINGLLSYARIGLEEISTDLVSIQDLLAEIIDSLDPPSTFSIEFPSALPTFCTKRILLNQVLSNLIGNAIKHHDRPDGKISISVEEYTESSEFYKFVIADDGKGIDPQQQKRIFNIFQTLDSTKSESTGIGLAIVQKIVESQGGSIWVESDLGKGSAFSFTWH